MNIVSIVTLNSYKLQIQVMLNYKRFRCAFLESTQRYNSYVIWKRTSLFTLKQWQTFKHIK